MISIIVAISEDYGIGKDNDLLWHIPEDLKRFKKLTTGHCVVMGKRTWDSLPKRPLPGRKNVVLTDIPGEILEQAVTAYSVADAIEKSKDCNEVFIIGGGSIYRQFMPLADRLYITWIHRNADADTWFPEINEAVWNPVEKEEFPGDQESIPPYTYVIYQRREK